MNIRLVNNAVRLQIGYDYKSRLRESEMQHYAQKIQKLLDVMTPEERQEFDRRIK